MGVGCVAELIIDVDDGLLEEVKKVCEDKGLTIDDAINIFLKNISDNCKLPDEILENLFYCDENIEYLERKYRDYKEGKLKFIIHN